MNIEDNRAQREKFLKGARLRSLNFKKSKSPQFWENDAQNVSIFWELTRKTVPFCGLFTAFVDFFHVKFSVGTVHQFFYQP